MVDEHGQPRRHRPRALDPLAGHDLAQLLVDAPGGESQRELAQRGQVRLGEEPVERQLGAIGRIDVAVPHALPQRARAHVDQLDLLRRVEHLIGQPLVDRGAGDGGDRVRPDSTGCRPCPRVVTLSERDSMTYRRGGLDSA